jgi:predicted DNA-binding transcriptional regulator AlpA
MGVSLQQEPIMEIDIDNALTIKEVQEDLGVGRTTLWRWRKSGKGPPFKKIGQGVVYPNGEGQYDRWKEEEYLAPNSGYQPSI